MMGATSDDVGAAAAAAGMRGYRYKHGDRPLPGYTIQRAAGRGGFGEVYYALSDSGREVALKVVNAYEEIELRGIGQCMNLKGPHLVSIFDVRYADDGQPVVIMEYVSGPNLRDLLDQHPTGFGPQKAAFFLREIGKGLTYLHDCGIVHRDLKPANIFYENGYVKIGDYGLSKMISASQRSAQTVTVGTLHYMAPEVGAGRYDRSIDIYALGALLFEMLTGRPPFYGVTPAEVLMKHINAPVTLDGIEEPFATVIRKALAKDPAERYQTVQEMVEAVFGADHVRESVSMFSPNDLTVVAGRVADQAGLRPGHPPRPPEPLSSRAYDVAADRGPAYPLPWFAQRARRHAGTFVRKAWFAVRCPNRIPAFARNRRRASPQPTEPPPMVHPLDAPPAVDPLARGQRVVLMLIAAVAIAVAAGAFADHRGGGISGMFALLGIVGGTIGVRRASARALPALEQESWLLRHLAMGGFAAAIVVALTFPVWMTASNDGFWRRYVGGTLASVCLSLLVVDWARRTSPTRPVRVSLRDLVLCGAVALVTAGMFDGAPEVAIAVLCGTCIAAQIVCPWTPGTASAHVGAQVRDPAPVAFAAEAIPHPAIPPAPPAPPTPPPSGVGYSVDMPTVYNLARRSVAAGKAVVVWPIRLALHVLSHAFLAAALALSMAVAFDIPGLLASGRIDPNLPRDIRAGMGVENWPFVLRSLGVAAIFLLACLATTLMMWMRRSSGGVHMLRAVLGAALLLWGPFILAGKGIDWVGTGQPMTNGWHFWQAIAQHLTPDVAIRGGLSGIAGAFLLLWPAPRPKPTPAAAAAPAATPAPIDTVATANK